MNQEVPPEPPSKKEALTDVTVQRWLDGLTPKKVIVVPKWIVNVVV